MKIYLAATYTKQPIMQQIARRLISLGHIVTSSWIHGTIDSHYRLEAEKDVHDIYEADTLIFFTDLNHIFFPDKLIHQTRGGRHTELGLALGLQKRIILVGDRENIFHYLPKIEQVNTIDEMLEILDKVNLKENDKVSDKPDSLESII
jgi:hypothetical protein